MEVINNEAIKKFTEQMAHELKQNAHKGNWETWNNVNEIFWELLEHIGKLQIAIKHNDKPRCKELIADCANYLMFLGNAGHVYTE